MLVTGGVLVLPARIAVGGMTESVDHVVGDLLGDLVAELLDA